MPWRDIKPFTGFEAWESGNYPLVLSDYDIGTTRPEKGSKLMITAHFSVSDNDHPALQNYVGKNISDWFVLGMDDDPDVNEDETLESGKNMGVSKIRALGMAASVDVDEDASITVDLLTTVLDQAVGTEIVGIIKKKGKGTDTSNNINGYVKPGELQLGLTGTQDKKDKKSSFGGKPTAPQSVSTIMKKALDAKKAKKVKEEEAPAAEAPAPKITKAKKVKCPLQCGQDIEYAELASHVETCSGPDDED